MSRNSLADALVKLAKELSCPDDEVISIKIQNFHILTSLNFKNNKNSIFEN